MAEIVQMFLFLYKSKYRRKRRRPIGRRQHQLELTKRFKQQFSGGITVVPCLAPPFWWAALFCCWLLQLSVATSSSSTTTTTEPSCDTETCINGDCVNGTCFCREGWQGPACQFCGGKFYLALFLRDIGCWGICWVVPREDLVSYFVSDESPS
ncbi:hypothetical protein M0802_015773 [Mischocyttarus mexicanus]|nr:hypothetical protein M0802_015773 [Mischocyttarus mexicanus]